jgi:hypothetical protein
MYKTDWKPIFLQVDISLALSELNPVDKGDHYLIDCPSCGRHNTFIYKGNKNHIECNHKNTCGYKSSLWDYVQTRAGLSEQDTAKAIKGFAGLDGNITTGVYSKPRPQAKLPKPRKLNPQRPPVFSFNDAMDIIDDPYALEERSAILEFEAGFNRHDSEQLAMKMHKLCDLQTRLFHLCFNPRCRNKERTPYAKDYEPAVLTIDGIKNIIKRGYSFTPALFAPEPEKNSRAYRDQKHWLQSELIVLDIDSGYKTVDDILHKANSVNGFLFAYTTPSHTPQNPRMRLIYHLDYIETDFTLYKRAVKALSKKLLTDTADNACHSYFGNTEAIFYDRGGE